MANIFQKAAFRTPKYNVFPQPNEVKLSYEIGKLVPCQFWDLGPGDSIKTRLQELTRFAPMLAPVFQRFNIDFHAIAVPHRLAIPIPNTNYSGYFDGFESFHNLAVDDQDRPTMPQMTLDEYLHFLIDKGVNPIGTLFDYLQYPTFDSLYRQFIELLGAAPGATDLSGSNVEWISFAVDASTVYNPYPSFSNVTLSDNTVLPSILAVLCQMCVNGFTMDQVISDNSIWTDDDMVTNVPWFIESTDSVFSFKKSYSFDKNALDQWIIANFGSAAACVDKYIDLIYTQICLNAKLQSWRYSLSSDDLATPYSLLPIYSYWSAVYDWYINTNLETDAEDKIKWLADKGVQCYPYVSGSTTSWLTDSSTSSWVTSDFFIPFDRYWANDYFTSAFLSAQSGSAVSIPNGTIADLRNANSLQKFMEKLLYSGKRIIDVTKTIFGIESSDARLDRCQVIGSHSANVNFMDVTQTSQSDVNSQLGQFAGQGLSVDQRNSFIDFTAEEHTLVMVFMSVRPNAVYSDQVNKLNLKVDPYDFLIPDFANVGEQPIVMSEIAPFPYSGISNDVFGYTRRYAEYMFTPSHVHGEFRTSLDYWHDARRFDSKPTLNVSFCKVTGSDDLNRIFAAPAAKEHLYSFLHFDTLITRPLGKFVEYSL